MTQKLGELRAELEEIQAAYSEALTDLGRVIDTAQRNRDDWHVGVFRFCDHASCKLAVELDDSWSGELS